MIKYKEKKIDCEKVLENLYLFVFGVFAAYMFLGTTMFEISWPYQFYNKILIALAALILARICFSERYSIQETIICVILVCIFLYAWKMNGYVEIYYLLLMLIGSRGISGKKIIRLCFGITVGLLVITIAAALTGHVENLVFHQGERTRMALGIGYPTDLSAYVFYASLEYIYIRGKKVKWYDVAGILVAGVLIYRATDARMNFLCTLVLVVGMTVYLIWRKLCEKRERQMEIPGVLSLLFALMPVLCAGGIITLSLIYTPTSRILSTLNRLLNNRLYYAKWGIDNYGFSLWGKYIEMIGNGRDVSEKTYYFFIDSSYVSGILRWGCVVFAILLLIMLVISFRARSRKNWILLWIMALISIQCVVEHHLIEVVYNPFLWLLFAKEAEDTVREEGDRGRPEVI